MPQLREPLIVAHVVVERPQAELIAALCGSYVADSASGSMVGPEKRASCRQVVSLRGRQQQDLLELGPGHAQISKFVRASFQSHAIQWVIPESWTLKSITTACRKRSCGLEQLSKDAGWRWLTLPERADLVIGILGQGDWIIDQEAVALR